MSKNRIVTTDMILAKRGLAMLTPEPFHSDLFEGDLIIENNHPQSFLETLSQGATDQMFAYSKLIYENCPQFREKELIKELEIDDPYLIPKTLYGSNIIEFIQLGDYILKCYGYNTENLENIKKK